jgi:hypothetical protein
MVTVVGGLIAYTLQPKKTSLELWRGEVGTARNGVGLS